MAQTNLGRVQGAGFYYVSDGKITLTDIIVSRDRIFPTDTTILVGDTVIDSYGNIGQVKEKRTNNNIVVSKKMGSFIDKLPTKNTIEDFSVDCDKSGQWLTLDTSDYSYCKLVYTHTDAADSEDGSEDERTLNIAITAGDRTKRALVNGNTQQPIEVTIEMIRDYYSGCPKYFMYGYGELIGFENTSRKIVSYSLYETNTTNMNHLGISVTGGTLGTSSRVCFRAFGILKE